MRRILRGLLLSASLCISAMPAHAEPITLNVLIQGTEDPYRTIAEAFQKAHPEIRLNIGTPVPSYEEILQRTLRGIVVGDVPDVAFQGYNLMRQAAASKAVADLTARAMDETSLAANGYDTALSHLCTVDGKVVGLPFAISLPILFYNADLVRKAGGDPDAFPTTWDGVVSLAERIHALDPKYQGIYFRYAHSGNWSFQALITSSGGRMMGDDDKTIAFSGPAGVQALGLFRTFVDRGGMIDMSADQARQAFLASTIGIISDSSSFLTSVSKSAAGKFELRTASYPLAADVGRLPPGGNCATVATQDPVRQEAAWTFVKYAVGPEAQRILAEQTGYVPVNKKALADFIAQTDPSAKLNVALPASLLPRLTQWYGFPPPNSAKITDAIKGRIQSVVSKAATPDQAMQSMVSDVQTLLKAGAQ
ncbi:ABC transporter substrate-binding protein [Dongia sedimenti]|uniref:ABC transporter substrate-binding protein n=1 Tax=Dongia sedimenti TaxID=3064282 RepID=A0ABU0YTI7_9PROT|nr:ABC transporter substrate-binding protein [Rhodospirillaceae bacterium R-7]